MVSTTTIGDAAPASLEEQLLLAAAAGDADEVARLIELEADVDYQDEHGVSPLMKAAEGGHTAVLAALLQSGAPWNAQDNDGYCAGEYAMGSGQQDAVDLLLDFAVQAELVLGALQRRMQVGAPAASTASNADYLSQKLLYRDEQLLDADGEAVMMGWERPLMIRHAALICPGAAADAAATAGSGRSEAAGAATSPTMPLSEARTDAVLEAQAEIVQASSGAKAQAQRMDVDVGNIQGVETQRSGAEGAEVQEAAVAGSQGNAETTGGREAEIPSSDAEGTTMSELGPGVFVKEPCSSGTIAVQDGPARDEQQQQGQEQEQQTLTPPPPHEHEELPPSQRHEPQQAEQERQQQQLHQQQQRRGGGGRVLNVGFGLGIVDTAIQSHHPERHSIVEAHPDVYEHMVRQGWTSKPGVRVLKGRWQDVLPELLTEAPYDGIFFDTYGEYYEEMREFHMHLPRLLAPTGVYSFFNGLASDNTFFHMVYCRLISLELAAKELTVEYEPVEVGSLGDEVWQGVRSKYWHFETYFLPRVTHAEPMESVEEGEEPAEEGREADEGGAHVGQETEVQAVN